MDIHLVVVDIDRDRKFLVQLHHLSILLDIANTEEEEAPEEEEEVHLHKLSEVVANLQVAEGEVVMSLLQFGEEEAAVLEEEEEANSLVLAGCHRP